MLRKHATTLIVAVAVVAMALDNGGFDLTPRSVLGILLWWTILVSLGLGLTPRRRPGKLGIALITLFGAFTLFTGLSVFWASSTERALAEFDRVSLYFAIVVFAVIAADFRRGAQWANGLAAGTTVVALLALGQRCFPDAFPKSDLTLHIPNAVTRLAYPLGYWNGLAAFLGLGFPLLLRAALDARAPLARAIALAPVPVLVAAIYLTSSRGGAAVALISTILFLIFTPRRLGALLLVVLGAVGGLGAVLVLNSRSVLVDGPLTSSAAKHDGPLVALMILLISVATGAAGGALSSWLPHSVSLRPAVRRVLVAVIVIACVGGVIASDPPQRIRAFKAPPASITPGAGFTVSHLFSGGGNGRWQFWSGAVDEFDAHPVVGNGAGSFQAWWAQHGSLGYFVRNAHSLYLETLGELGIVGLLLLAGAFVVGVISGARRLSRRFTEAERMLSASLLAAFLAFAAGAAVEWIWQFAVIGGVALVCLALMATPDEVDPVVQRPQRRRGLRGSFTAVGIGLVAWALIVLQAIPLLANNEVRASESAARKNNLAEALKRADAARALEPWATSPRLQAALVLEQAGDLAGARHQIASALDRDHNDWELWFVSARLETKAGNIPQATRALDEARRLNPHSPLLQ